VDPGLNTALAYFDEGTLKTTDIFKCPKDKKGSDSVSRKEQLHLMGKEFQRMLSNIPSYTTVFIEGVQVYSSSMKSCVAAFRGDTVFLSQLVGVYMHICDTLGKNVYILLPREWRGNMPDAVVVERIKRRLGVVYPEHISDAVGIGLSVLGRL
jgi:hypothetical protein